MESLNIFEIKETIKKYINGQSIPAEVKRMCLAEVLEEIAGEARREIIAQAEARENKQEGNKDGI